MSRKVHFPLWFGWLVMLLWLPLVAVGFLAGVVCECLRTGFVTGSAVILRGVDDWTTRLQAWAAARTKK